MLSVTSRYSHDAKYLNTVGDGSYTITASDVFQGGGSSNGGVFYLSATFLVYPSEEVYLMRAWWVQVYINGVEVLSRGFSPDGSYDGYLDDYIYAKEGDVVRIVVRPSLTVGGIGSITGTDAFYSYTDATVRLGY
jgi:hypothetical protein